MRYEFPFLDAPDHAPVDKTEFGECMSGEDDLLRAYFECVRLLKSYDMEAVSVARDTITAPYSLLNGSSFYKDCDWVIINNDVPMLGGTYEWIATMFEDKTEYGAGAAQKMFDCIISARQVKEKNHGID